MKHLFDVSIAMEVGVNSAILLEFIGYWISKNIANETNFQQGKCWTYNSIKALSKLYPYMTERGVNYAIKKLKNAGFIETGKHNNSPYDHTLWYTLTEKGYNALEIDIPRIEVLDKTQENPILQNCKIDVQKKGNHILQNCKNDVQNLLDQSDVNVKTNTVIITNKLHTNKLTNRITDICIYQAQQIADAYSHTCKNNPKLKGLTERRIKEINKLFLSYKPHEIKKAFQMVAESDFLSGRKVDWKAPFDWIIKPENLTKILEGNYANHKENDLREAITKWANSEQSGGIYD